MISDKINRERLNSLEKILEIEYEKLSDFQSEYGEILFKSSDASLVPQNEAEETLAEIVQVVEHIEVLPAETYPSEMLELLREIKQKLDEPGKTAAAKLKVALPIIPMLASYELEMDTEATFIRVWQRIKSLFKDEL